MRKYGDPKQHNFEKVIDEGKIGPACRRCGHARDKHQYSFILKESLDCQVEGCKCRIYTT